MQQRLDYISASPGGFKAMLAVENHCRAHVEEKLYHMVKLRASQINGCAYCIDMHWQDARAAGETEQRLYALDAWQESPFYTDKERAALRWTEVLTRISTTHAPDEDFRAVKAHFSDQELADLSWTIAAINAWNRIAIGFRSQPGVYKPRKLAGV